MIREILLAHQYKEIANVIDEISSAKVFLLERELESLGRELYSYFLYFNREADEFIISIQSSINSYEQGLAAATTYGVDWFSKLPYSVDKKVQIAAVLIKSIKKQKIDVPKLWELIVQKNVTIVEQIKFKMETEDAPS
jgi:hypothetical protein